MLKSSIRQTGLLTLGVVALGLAGFATGAQADDIVSHTQSTVQVGAPQAVTTTRTNTVVDPQGNVEGQVIQRTTTVPGHKVQTSRTTTLNPDGSVEARSQANRTVYDANGNLITTSSSSVHSSDGVVAVVPGTVAVVPGVIVNHDGDVEVYNRVEPSVDSHTNVRDLNTTGYGAFKTGGNFNE